MCSNDQRVDIIVGSLYREQNYNQRTGPECVGNTILCPDVHAIQQGASVTFLVTEAYQAKIVLFVQRMLLSEDKLVVLLCSPTIKQLEMFNNS